MLYIILFTGILCIYSLQPYNTQKKCVNCEFFLKKQISPFHWDTDSNHRSDYGKCSLFKKDNKRYNKNTTVNHYVVGEELPNDGDYFYCTTARSFNDMCGADGRFYRQKKTYIKTKCDTNLRNKIRNKIRNMLKHYLYPLENEEEYIDY